MHIISSISRAWLNKERFGEIGVDLYQKAHGKIEKIMMENQISKSMNERDFDQNC